MRYMDSYTYSFCQLAELILPKPGFVAIAAPAIARYHKFCGIRKRMFSYGFPPTGDALYCKFCGVVACPYIHKSNIVIQVINPIGRDFTQLFNGKVVVKHAARIFVFTVFLPW